MPSKKEIPEEQIVVGSGDQVCYVYGLRFRQDNHPHSGRIRYVGKAVDPWRRFSRHMNPNESRGRVQRSILKNGPDSFSLVILAKAFGSTRGEAEKLAFEWERYFISHFRTMGSEHGLNLTTGGEGATLSEAARRKHSKSRARNLNEVKQRPEVREKLTQKIRQRNQDPDYIARVRATNATPETKERRSRGNRKRYENDPNARLKAGEVFRRLWKDPEFRARSEERKRKILDDPEFKRKLSDRAKAQNKDPEWRKKVSAGLRRYNANEEVRTRKSNIARAQHADPEFAQKYHEGLRKRYSDPVKVAEHAEHSREMWKNPAMKRAVTLGVHLRWAKTHLASGKIEAANKQISSLRALLAECGDDPAERRQRDAAQAFLAELDAAI